jgi:hypothetical protein
LAATTRRLSTEALGPTDALPGAACGTTEEQPVANTAAAAKDAEHAVSDGVDDVVRLGAGEGHCSTLPTSPRRRRTPT